MMKWEHCNCNWKKVFTILVIFALLTSLVIYHSPRLSIRQFQSIPTTKSSVWLNKIKHAREQEETIKFLESSTEKGNLIDDKFGKVNFDINGSDVLVFLHMQKTGGSEFGRHLVSNLILSKECDILEHRKRRNCLRPNSDVETWIFSRYSTGWACGLHSGWTDLHECIADKMTDLEKVDKKRNFFYVTMLRDPVKRYLSEWKHVQRGATWRTTRYACKGREYDIPKCYTGNDWREVSLQQFMSCQYNMAHNRQTRMLADLRLANCYQRWSDKNMTVTQIKQIENDMLKSAMDNLRDMTFFGLLEQQEKFQKLFEYIFPFKFKNNFVQSNMTRVSTFVPTKEEIDEILELNYLDVKLYDFAKKLFERRYIRSIS
uniref:heparan-sulfate 6-O-sulfotransferase 1-B-like n=1 Tax=Styela clava TaxID=7725 RepID=UPI00193AD8FF|nr:heparan-sulfate 6-O-sulfotransferase 1-B-like [Styela clava]